MQERDKKIVVGRKEIALAGGIQAALEEALSLAALRMTPRAITAYEEAGSPRTEQDGARVVVLISVGNEAELREAIGAGAEAVMLENVTAEEEVRLREMARELRADCAVYRLGAEAEGDDV